MTNTLVFSFGHEGNSSIDFKSLELALSLIQNKMTHAMFENDLRPYFDKSKAKVPKTYFT